MLHFRSPENLPGPAADLHSVPSHRKQRECPFQRVTLRVKWKHLRSNQCSRISVAMITETGCRRDASVFWAGCFLFREWLLLSNYTSAFPTRSRLQPELLATQELCRNLNGNQSSIFCYLIMKMLIKSTTQPPTSPTLPSRQRLNIQHCYK